MVAVKSFDRLLQADAEYQRLSTAFST